ncbi:MotA/TolQ/ExbB proton channel family protein [Szabonella alba]|uniref:MotA/TolQ/ExbB proton channel family protein n=1 Tax=Szabonella alba TaxID=2804194 RepID=A0A8K0Y087_9RHOB|nr:MotA/TolQ/ExbB proton channel family protein [Szabonella alba]MBL4917940.1 MotA/TolQ/ExbB proton channel family protein [Szabonella alba]
MPDLAGFDAVTLTVFAALIALSAFATTISLFKIGQFAMLGLGRVRLAETALTDWHRGQRDGALASVTAPRGGVLARVLQAVFQSLTSRPQDLALAEEMGRQTALAELARLSKWMRALEAVVQAAPMLGLLGTVVGMIDAFGTLAQSTGGVDPALLAGGIWTALTTTALGLSIALIFYFIALWLEGRIETERQQMERLLSAALHGRAGAVAGAGATAPAG